MRTLVAGMVGIILVFSSQGSVPHQDLDAFSRSSSPREIDPRDLTAVVQRYCQVCHNDQLLTGNLSLQGFDVADPVARAATAERMIQKLRVGMMPPPGAPRPGGDTLMALVRTLEQTLDRAAAAHPNPGSRSFQRLNRAEYEASIRDLLGMEVRGSDFLPPDTKMANFDNMADAQMLSPTLMDAYLRAATTISRLALGNPSATSGEAQYRVVRQASQMDRVEGAPFGTRGGISVIHTFPADGEYVFRMSFPHDETGTVFGSGRSALHTADHAEQMEISIDGDRVALLEVDRWLHVSDPNGATIRTGPIFIHSGPHRVTAAFVQKFEGPLADLITPLDWTQSNSGVATYGILLVPHLRDLVVAGPQNPTGVSDTPIRQRVFTCRPSSPAEATPCARQILSELANRAFRRTATEEEIQALLGFYDQGAGVGGFEEGIRVGLEAILASPRFAFRFERMPKDAKPGESFPIGDFELASRLSYFLWGTPPDEDLRALAREGKLSDRRVLERETRRMLADPRSESLATRFAAQWLRLPDLASMEPDVNVYPDFHQQLGTAMRRETELFFYGLVRDDRPLLELFTSDYTYVNERLAKHYGIRGVVGEEFRRVQYPDESRRGLFGHASILTLTSVPSRTSPVLRGKWVMEVILGTPPPPPPPGVPDLEQTSGTLAGRVLTTRERMEQHRKAAVCNSCHRFMDPIGLALDNYDVTGKWRIRENGAPLDTRGQLWDGTPVTSPKELQEALLRRPEPILRNFTSNLMAFSLGRRVEYYDMPAVRQIVAAAEVEGYRMSAFVLGVVNSGAFRMRKPAAATDNSANAQRQ